MSVHLQLNRRSGIDRRLHPAHPEGPDRRYEERRHPAQNDYVLVIGHGGIDRVGLLLMAIPILVLAAFAIFQWVAG